MDLTELRKEIDAIDDEMVRLFGARMETASRIAAYKRSHNLPVLMPKREQEKLRDLASKSAPGMESYTRELYEKIFALSRTYQEVCSRQADLKCGLLGRKLSYSYSPAIHKFLGNYDYSLFEREPEDLEDFLKNGDFTGINVTIPYKKPVIPYCAELSPAAEKLGAVNTIVRREDGTLIGHNTDCHGFTCLLESTGLNVSGKKCLVLGSGGASNTVCAVLKEKGADVTVISRTGKNNYENLYLHKDAYLIVNATPVGTYPDTGVAPLSLDGFPELQGVLDLIYNPAKTRLLLEAEDRGIVAGSGLRMLVEQAKESAEWFTGEKISDEISAKVFSAVQKNMSNLILIGMPGCGKTTLGKLLQARFPEREFVDTDQLVAQAAGMTIPEIFSRYGEERFRSIETEVLASVGKKSGQIIATGGGCVTRAENYPLLHQNGIIVWIQRDLNALPKNGRPLSQKSGAAELYAVREPMYRKFADFTVRNQGTPEDTAEEIRKQFDTWFREEK